MLWLFYFRLLTSPSLYKCERSNLQRSAKQQIKKHKMSIKNTLATALELKITLKKLKTFPGHDGMEGFDADICLGGKTVLHVYDSAHGGCFEYRPVKGQTHKGAYQMEAEFEEMLKPFPKHKVKLGTKEFEIKDSLYDIVSALVSEHSFQKGLKRDSKKGVLIEADNGYSIIKFKAGTLTKMIKDHSKEAVVNMLQGHVDKMIKDGDKILNLEYLKSIGIKIKQ